MIHNMNRDAEVPRNEWLKFFDQFANGNQGVRSGWRPR